MSEIELLDGRSVAILPSGRVTGKCKYCGEDILWCITTWGRKIPVSKDRRGHYICHLAVCERKNKRF
jgi:hypothetical protein